MISKKKLFFIFKECGEFIDREGWGVFRRLVGYKKLG